MALSVAVLAYDIADDRRRTRAHRLLGGYGIPLQESVFLLELSESQWIILRRRLTALVRPGQDLVYVWPLCAACVARAQAWCGIPRAGPAAITII